MSKTKLRRSALVGVYGPGAIIDIRAEGSGVPISALISGLESWDESAKSKGVLHPQFIHEQRLEKLLHVSGFRLPPIRLDTDKSQYDILPIIRFPKWMQCPQCHRIGTREIWGITTGRPEVKCTRCSEEGAEVFVVPVRFIVACEGGHLDDFPWKMWASCKCLSPKLYLETTGPGLAGKMVRCKEPGCQGTPRSLDGVFGKDTLGNMKLSCRGLRPWLAVAPETCTHVPRVLQRGASNVYWGKILSALDIPPFSTDLSGIFGQFWPRLKDKSPDKWPALIELLELDKETGLPVEQLLAKLGAWKKALEQDPEEPLEWKEYQQFEEACSNDVQQGEFNVKTEPPPANLCGWLSGVGLAYRLREVRTMVGFTRIKPPSGPFASIQSKLCHLSAEKKNWLPGIELRGEGVFIRLDTNKLKRWEALDTVKNRTAMLKRKLEQDKYDDDEVLPDCSPRFLLLHSFAHALMRQLSLECGYSSSSLVERIYAGQGQYEMAGILIHTGSVDSEGTLGGLVRQGKQNLLGTTIINAISAMAWCSSDPLCISGAATLSSPRNAAACHACLLVPETSCQHFNVLLDRALLIGTPGDKPEDKELGFFYDLLETL
jgi:hypothetical protein